MKKIQLFIFFLVIPSLLQAQNPVLVSDIATGSSSSPSDFVLLDNKIFFAASVWTVALKTENYIHQMEQLQGLSYFLIYGQMVLRRQTSSLSTIIIFTLS